MENIRMSAYSDIGGRRENEDSYGCMQGHRGSFWVTIADGLGSYGGGKIASDIAVNESQQFFNTKTFCTPDELTQLFATINEKILLEQDKGTKMRTTAVILAAQGKKLIWGHVGDTRMYHYLNNDLIFYTTDHSVPQMEVAMGQITRDQIPGHPDRNKLTRAIGMEGLKPEIHEPIKLEPGKHAFLFCTDGFWDYVTEEEMGIDLLLSKSPDQWLYRMRRRLRRRCGKDNDNNTAVAVFAEVKGLFGRVPKPATPSQKLEKGSAN